jgi:hypothetical protein
MNPLREEIRQFMVASEHLLGYEVPVEHRITRTEIEVIRSCLIQIAVKFPDRLHMVKQC